MMKSARNAVFHALACGLMTKLNKYAAKIGMDTDEAVDGLVGSWENGETGLIRSIHGGDFEAFLDEELAN